MCWFLAWFCPSDNLKENPVIVMALKITFRDIAVEFGSRIYFYDLHLKWSIQESLLEWGWVGQIESWYQLCLTAVYLLVQVQINHWLQLQVECTCNFASVYENLHSDPWIQTSLVSEETCSVVAYTNSWTTVLCKAGLKVSPPTVGSQPQCWKPLI